MVSRRVQLKYITFTPILIAGFLIRTVSVIEKKTLEEYSAAGGLATEAINSIRTVTALNMQPTLISKYREYLFNAKRYGTSKAFNIGIGIGSLFFSIFVTYSVGVWYGANLIADDVENQCTENCIQGGEVMSCFFCIVMGGVGLGTVSNH